MDVRVGLWRKLRAEELMLLNCDIGEDSWESLGLQGDPTKDWCWSWNSNTLATWCQELTHLERPWCCKRLKAKGEGDDRGWDGWMASPTWWTWVWPSSGSWWRTGKPGGLQSIWSQRVGHDWATELKSLRAWGPTTCVLIRRLADSDHTKIWEPHIPAWQVLQSSASLWDAGEKTKSTAQNRTWQEQGLCLPYH